MISIWRCCGLLVLAVCHISRLQKALGRKKKACCHMFEAVFMQCIHPHTNIQDTSYCFPLLLFRERLWRKGRGSVYSACPIIVLSSFFDATRGQLICNHLELIHLNMTWHKNISKKVGPCCIPNQIFNLLHFSCSTSCIQFSASVVSNQTWRLCNW